jgi:hypothetical protein
MYRNKLTFFVRNDAPMINFGDSPTYRTVTIELTEEQVKKINLKVTHESGTMPCYEEISRCFVEPF